MELRQLRYFVTLAEELHFGRAARLLGIAQPPLSQQIRRLEADLGVRLFDRTSRRVSLTPAGTALLEEARLLVRRADTVRDAIRSTQSQMLQHFDLGAVSPAIDTFLPKALRRLLIEVPQTSVTLHELHSADQIEWVRTGRLDAGVIRLFEHDLYELQHRVVRREGYLLAVPQDHALARRRIVPLSALHDEPMIMAPRQRRPELHDRIISSCREAGAELRVVQEAPSKRTEVALVASGLGLAFVPASYADVFTRPGVVYRHLRGTLPAIEIVAIWNLERNREVLQRFLQLIEE